MFAWANTKCAQCKPSLQLTEHDNKLPFGATHNRVLAGASKKFALKLMFVATSRVSGGWYK